MSERRIGIIGGSGLYQMEGLTKVKSVAMRTPFGKPSDALVLGELQGRPVAFLPRHGRGHRIMPHELNFRANIHAMKQIGVEWIISVSAVGSMKEHIHPRDIVIPDQFFDRTRMRVSTFFGEGIAAHIGFADPVCPVLGDLLHESAVKAGATVHKGGTYLCMEGPQFSTRAESRTYRSWGMTVIGMTNLQEAKLAREAEICYATMALVTDYDVWHETEEDVTVDAIIQNLLKNVETAKAVIKLAVPRIAAERKCHCPNALATAIITDKKSIPPKLRKKLKLLIGKYV
ncbi:MAG: S-methyl-5'-thioadenosine phosphorylase [Planctomycetes bacterium]|nr:S-methyl-5'-thioadenosine phosphorylase [Planctomycetota bacterium]MBM4078897.1 S-methyl-5'-thioadenosine phosphorylase [Planctomycetota bacterium]